LNWIWRLLFFFIGQRAKFRLLRTLKKQGVLAYLRALQGTRRALMLVVALLAVLQLMTLALAGAIVCGFLLWNADFEFKLEVLLGTCLTLFAIPALGLAVLFSQRLWYKASGAKGMVEALQKKGQARDHSRA
jgi:hypothetical protein